MRIISAMLVALMALWPSVGATAPKAKPAPARSTAAQSPKAPAAGSPRAVYAAMPEHERMTIQADLIWTGDYNGIIDTDFGDNSVAAVKTFQKRNGGRETGLLNPDERAKLSESAHAKREHAGWRMVDDRATGARVGVPGKLVPQSAPSGSGTRWQSSRGEVQVETFRIAAAGTLASVFERVKKEPANRRPEYHLCNVAAGRFDGFWEFNLNPWDTAAGVLIVEEAGGRVTDFSGGPFQIASQETLASNGLVHDALIHEFQQIFAGRGLEELASPVAYAKDRSL